MWGNVPISEQECKAMRLLHEDGRDPKELAFILERNERSVRKHLSEECKHERDYGTARGPNTGPLAEGM